LFILGVVPPADGPKIIGHDALSRARPESTWVCCASWTSAVCTSMSKFLPAVSLPPGAAPRSSDFFRRYHDV